MDKIILQRSVNSEQEKIRHMKPDDRVGNTRKEVHKFTEDNGEKEENKALNNNKISLAKQNIQGEA